MLSCLLFEKWVAPEAWVTGARFQRAPSLQLGRTRWMSVKSRCEPAGCGPSVCPGSINHSLSLIEVSECEQGWLVG